MEDIHMFSSLKKEKNIRAKGGGGVGETDILEKPRLRTATELNVNFTFDLSLAGKTKRKAQII